ncbi:hypothetical protein CSE45_1773 [Citreicella sp. SE45]|nr:hypothetical protein CSE45_1773 [Citreicella sp. SE45]
MSPHIRVAAHPCGGRTGLRPPPWPDAFTPSVGLGKSIFRGRGCRKKKLSAPRAWVRRARRNPYRFITIFPLLNS